ALVEESGGRLAAPAPSTARLPGPDPATRRDLDRRVALAGWVLHQRDQPAGHEPARADRCAAAGHFGHLDDATGRRDFDPPAVPAGHDLERLHGPAGVDDDLDSITPHRRRPQPAVTGVPSMGTLVVPRSAAARSRIGWP